MTLKDKQTLAMVEMLAKVVKQGAMRIEDVSPQMQGNVRDYLAMHVYSEAGGVKRLLMQYQREDRALAAGRVQEMIAAGHVPYQPQQAVYTALLKLHLDGCESGQYPAASMTAAAIANEKASKLLAKTAKKFLRQAIRENELHPGWQRLSSIVSSSTITAAISGTVSTCLRALSDTHKIARRVGEQQARIEALSRCLTDAQAHAQQAHVRLSIVDQGTNWKEAARAIRAAEPGISNTALAVRVGKSEGAIRKYRHELEANCDTVK